MTTPTTVLGLSHIQTEFGGSHPIAMSEYYGVNANVASSGEHRMARFLGISSGPPIRLPSISLSAIDFLDAESRATWGANGTFLGQIYESDGSGWTTQQSVTWLGSGAASAYEIRATKTSGTGNAPTFSSGWANNTFAAMSSDRYVAVSQSVNGFSTATLTITIRYAANGTTANSTTCTLTAEEK